MIKLALALWLATGAIEPPPLGAPHTPAVPEVKIPDLPTVRGPLDPKPPTAKPAPKVEAPAKPSKRKSSKAKHVEKSEAAEEPTPTEAAAPVVHPEPAADKPVPKPVAEDAAKPVAEKPAQSAPAQPDNVAKPAKPAKPAPDKLAKSAKPERPSPEKPAPDAPPVVNKTALAAAVAGAPPAPAPRPVEEEIVVAKTPSESASKNGAEPPRKTRTISPTRDRPVAVLPSLSSSALKTELRKGAGNPQPAAAGAPGADRARMEQLATELEQARESLRQETARLEAVLKQQGSPPVGENAAAPEAAAAPAVPAAPARTPSKEDDQQIILVSKAMKGMKPAEAAAVLSHVDRFLAAEVLRRMRPADAGAVMAALKPELAATLATDIATRKPSTTFKKGGDSR